MRDHDPGPEQEFFRVFEDYYDLEQAPARRYTTTEYSLDRMLPLARLAGNPERDLRILHVAGTKGKGSTCFFLTALLASAGRRCGTFTSPHLATVRERFQVNNQLVSYERLLAHSRPLEAAIRREGLAPSLFEIMTVLSLQIFVAEQCEFAVVETGIGGLLDSTNYVPKPECTVITPVSFDHTQLLGCDITQIAAQKAGIIKPGVPLVCGTQPHAEAAAVIRGRAAECDAPLFGPAPADEAAKWSLPGLPPFALDNFRTALQACTVVGISPDPDAFAMPQLRARCERIREQPLVILDAAHNADSAEKLVASLRGLYPGTDFTVVLGVVKGKDVEGVFRPLAELGCDFILTNPRSHKGSELDALVSLAQQAGVSYEVRPEITEAADLPADRNLLFTGSFFTALIGEMLFSPA